jgi:hypothetical protein
VRGVHGVVRLLTARGENVPAPKGHLALTRGTASGIGRCARTGKNRDGLKGIAARGRPERERTPRGVGADFKGLGVLPASGRSGLGKARAGPNCEAGAARAQRAPSAQRRPARNGVIVPCFERLKLKKNELKCSKW